MGFLNSRTTSRVCSDLGLSRLSMSDGEQTMKHQNSDKNQVSGPNFMKTRKGMSWKFRGALKSKVLCRVLSEDYEGVKRKVLDPRGKTIRKWNKIFLMACLVSLFVDPLFFYLQLVWREQCLDIGIPLEVVLTIIRSIADIFYIIEIFIRFHTAYVAPSSRVFGRGELVIDPKKIALRYLQKAFLIDFLAALPLPQAHYCIFLNTYISPYLVQYFDVVYNNFLFTFYMQVLIWIIIPNLHGSTITNTKNFLRFIIIFQYLPRLYLIFPLSSQIEKASGVVTEAAWAGAAYNLILYLLASHVLGACWYLLSIERKEACWRSVCDLEVSCEYVFFDCNKVGDPNRNAWFESSNVTNLCNPASAYYEFGIYGDALTHGITNSSFFHKYFYCLWWGLKNLSSLGQNLSTSVYIGEILFAIIIAILGLVLFALLIGNMQRYLQSTTVRIEEWRVKRNDTEQWMRHRQLPPYLRQSIRKYDQYKWVATRGVDEEVLLEGLPMDLRRDIKRHLCMDLVRRVPLFGQMDERTLDAVCERLKPTLCTEGTFLVREGDPVNEMLFIIRGHLDSYTTNGGRTGFFNSCHIGPGDFCGEELLTWALEPRPSIILPSSTRTVKAISEAEAFALRADDLKFVASQFRKLHSKEIRHKIRFYSHQWRTWAACFIQTAWRQYRRRRELAELRAREASQSAHVAEISSLDSGGTKHAAELVASRKGSMCDYIEDPCTVRLMRKPAEPDYSNDG